MVRIFYVASFRCSTKFSFLISCLKIAILAEDVEELGSIFSTFYNSPEIYNPKVFSVADFESDLWYRILPLKKPYLCSRISHQAVSIKPFDCIFSKQTNKKKVTCPLFLFYILSNNNLDFKCFLNLSHRLFDYSSANVTFQQYRSNKRKQPKLKAELINPTYVLSSFFVETI